MIILGATLAGGFLATFSFLVLTSKLPKDKNTMPQEEPKEQLDNIKPHDPIPEGQKTEPHANQEPNLGSSEPLKEHAEEPNPSPKKSVDHSFVYFSYQLLPQANNLMNRIKGKRTKTPIRRRMKETRPSI